MLRKTKILCTLGPASDSKEVLAELIGAGSTLFRLNMSHGTHGWVREVVARIRKVSKKLDQEVGILMDLRGPSIRTGDVAKGTVLDVGDRLHLRPPGSEATAPDGVAVSVDVNYGGLADDLSVGDTLLIDGGVIEAEVVSADPAVGVVGKVRIGGELTPGRHVNLPGVDVSLPALTKKDLEDLDLAVELGRRHRFRGPQFRPGRRACEAAHGDAGGARIQSPGGVQDREPPGDGESR